MNLRELEKVQQAFPPEGVDKRNPQQPKDRWLVVLEACKHELNDLCLSYCRREGWRPPSDVIYRTPKLPARRKVDHPQRRVLGVEDLSSGDEEPDDEVPVDPNDLLTMPEQCTRELPGEQRRHSFLGWKVVSLSIPNSCVHRLKILMSLSQRA